MPIEAAYIVPAGGCKIADSEPTEAVSQGRRGDDFFSRRVNMHINVPEWRAGPGELSAAANPSVLPSQVVCFSDNKAYVARV